MDGERQLGAAFETFHHAIEGADIQMYPRRAICAGDNLGHRCVHDAGIRNHRA